MVTSNPSLFTLSCLWLQASLLPWKTTRMWLMTAAVRSSAIVQGSKWRMPKTKPEDHIWKLLCSLNVLVIISSKKTSSESFAKAVEGHRKVNLCL